MTLLPALAEPWLDPAGSRPLFGSTNSRSASWSVWHTVWNHSSRACRRWVARPLVRIGMYGNGVGQGRHWEPQFPKSIRSRLLDRPPQASLRPPVSPDPKPDRSPRTCADPPGRDHNGPKTVGERGIGDAWPKTPRDADRRIRVTLRQPIPLFASGHSSEGVGSGSGQPGRGS